MNGNSTGDAIYVPTLLEYAQVIDWLWTERHNIKENRRSGVHLSDLPPELRAPFENALTRVKLSRERKPDYEVRSPR